MTTTDEFLAQLRGLVRRGEVLPSLHGFRELAADDILLDDVVTGLGDAVAVEYYADAAKGASILVLQSDAAGRPIHVIWGIARNSVTPAVIVTAYRPDPERWSADFTRRKLP